MLNFKFLFRIHFDFVFRQLISDELMRGALKLIEELKSLKSIIQEPDEEKIKNLGEF